MMMHFSPLSLLVVVASTGAIKPLRALEAALAYIPLTYMLSLIVIGMPSRTP
jgi:hypothetical protein